MYWPNPPIVKPQFGGVGVIIVFTVIEFGVGVILSVKSPAPAFPVKNKGFLLFGAVSFDLDILLNSALLTNWVIEFITGLTSV